MHRPPSFAWRGSSEAGELAAPALVEQDDVVPLARRLEIAVGRLGREDPLALGLGDEPGQHRPQLLVRPVQELGQPAPCFS